MKYKIRRSRLWFHTFIGGSERCRLSLSTQTSFSFGSRRCWINAIFHDSSFCVGNPHKQLRLNLSCFLSCQPHHPQFTVLFLRFSHTLCLVSCWKFSWEFFSSSSGFWLYFCSPQSWFYSWTRLSGCIEAISHCFVFFSTSDNSCPF